MNNYLLKEFASSLSSLFYYSGIHLATKPIYGGIGHILMLHRVLDTNHRSLRIHNHESLEISSDLLENIILYFKKRKYNFLSLDEMVFNLKERKTREKFVVFTFDDGYNDNLYHAFPVLRKYNVPFTVYVTTSFPEKRALLWWYALEDLLIREDKIIINDEKAPIGISCRNKKEKEMAFNSIRPIIQSYDEEETQNFFNQRNVDINAYSERLTLTWEEIVQLSSDELVTIGAHTVNHVALANQPENDAHDEMLLSKNILESKTGKSINHFSYPFGKKSQASKREFDLAEKCGFSSSTTTRLANIHPQHSQFLQSLPRITINSLTNEKVLALQTRGVFPMIKNKFEKLVTD